MNPTAKTTTDVSAKVALANRLFREFYAACFWHMKPDLMVTEALIPIIAKGLRTHGGRRGMVAADLLLQEEKKA